MGFFDVANRYAGLDAKADFLVKLTAMVPAEANFWELIAAGAVYPTIQAYPIAIVAWRYSS